MTTRISGDTFGVLPEAARADFLALLPAAGLNVLIPSGLLAYKSPCRLTAVLLPDPETVRLVLAGDDLRLGYTRGVHLNLGAVSLHLVDAAPTWQRSVGGITVNLSVSPGLVERGEQLHCSVTRDRPSYLLQACRDRLNTYRGYQLWDWTYGTRVYDMLDTLAETNDVSRELRQTFTGITLAELSSIAVTEPEPFRYRAVVRVSGEEVTFDI